MLAIYRLSPLATKFGHGTGGVIICKIKHGALNQKDEHSTCLQCQMRMKNKELEYMDMATIENKLRLSFTLQYVGCNHHKYLT